MVKSLMIQGTSSGVGKSIITTGLCRILQQDGYYVATFKAQNMTSNVYVLENGEQIAKSQWIATKACGIEATSHMNPVVLKILPHGTEVVVQGKSIGNMTSESYKSYKKDIFNKVIESYNNLCNQYEAIIIEGAGSPVEINLKENDIVNMGLAVKIKCPVILTVDIDRGGAFAYVKGTLELLTEEERALVKCIIINKCKGVKSYFTDIAKTMEQIAGIPVLGMVPYYPIDIEDEDNLIDAQVGVKTTKSIEHMNVQFDLLANFLRENLDIKKLYMILEEGGVGKR